MIKRSTLYDEKRVDALHKFITGKRASGSYWMLWKKADSKEKQKMWDELLDKFDDKVEELVGDLKKRRYNRK